MKLTQEQRAALQKANMSALRAHFTGDGAISRSLHFVRDGLLSSLGWLAKLLFVGSWAAIGSLLVGPEHEILLTQLHAWMVATPIDQVITYGHSFFWSWAWNFAMYGLILGFGQQLITVVRPAMEQTKAGFAKSAA